MPDLTLTPSEAIALSESITSITIHLAKIDPSKDVISITARAGNRSVVIAVDNSDADPAATPPVVGTYDQVVALADLESIVALLQPRIEAAFSS